MATTVSAPPTDAAIARALQALITSAQHEATTPATPAQQASARAVVAAASALVAFYTPAQQQATTTITVEQGDTLFSLALAVYGDARKYGGLVTLNGLTDPRLTPGQTLVVPVT